MDFWLVAAAAGAGYLAKYWQNIPKDRDKLLQLSNGDSDYKKTESSGGPFRILKHRSKLPGNAAKDKTFEIENILTDISPLDDASGTEVASTSGSSEKLGSLTSYQDLDVLSVLNLQAVNFGDENLKQHEEGGNRLLGGYDVSDNCYDVSLSPKHSAEEMDSIMKNISSIRTKRYRGHLVKPMNSLESCLMAQLYNEHAQMKEYVLNSVPSPSTPARRTLFVTDGSRVMGSAYNMPQTGTKACLEKNEKVFGVPPLPKVGSMSHSKKTKSKTGKGQNRKLCSSSKFSNGKGFHSQGGSLDGTVLFCLGISIGIISSFITNKSEVDKLKELLNQTENLVQDLHDELEMKDSLTVKELANENYESQDTYEYSISERAQNTLFSEQNIDGPIEDDARDSYLQKAEESSESMSKIEAELEAELERLGLNINASTQQRRLSDVVELEPDFVADFAQGELRVDMLGGKAIAKTKSSEDGPSTHTTHHSANYAVSPRQLSLRLHEVIQSRLEERVNELETALQNSQRKIQMIELERRNWGELSISPLKYPSMQESPAAREECENMSQPFVMALSGEALDAYNEAREELMKMSDSDEEDSPCRFYENPQGSCCSNDIISESQNGKTNGSVQHSPTAEEKPVGEFSWSNLRIQEERISLVLGSNETSDSQDEISDADDEIEKQLIKQIVERTKKGSPVVLNAQRLLFSLDENENQVEKF
ncbi:uncharacterized protein LOC115710274 isoform X1 [Cannabis sativa]|uniref:Uncharacterized protein n=1 Tax=Cannabis sativa TaxID=3483 RepID=A0A7J6GQ53_CANSA|nr:uncharacterized protein LOC115710274 isoform X1 [Cannabis sativa]KAF4385033.1 hypothetical protein G4B88_017834 [Cannabis sativa]